MNAIIRYLKLYIGIILNPSKTFDQIIEEKHILAGFLIWFFSSIFYLTTMSLIMQKASNEYGLIDLKMMLLFIPSILKSLKINLKLFGLYVSALVENIIAVKCYKVTSNYRELLISNLFISVIEILNSLFIVILIFYSSIFLINYLNIIFIPWSFILKILAIKKIYKISTKEAIEISLSSLLVIIFIAFTWVAINYIISFR